MILKSIIKTKHKDWFYVYYTTPEWLTVILSLCSIFFIVLSIIGIVNVCQNKAKEIPIINKIPIIK